MKNLIKILTMHCLFTEVVIFYVVNFKALCKANLFQDYLKESGLTERSVLA